MKRLIILLLSVIATFGSIFAQDQELLNSLLDDVKAKNISIIGCIINEEFIGEDLPFIKKMAFENESIIVFVMSNRYSNEKTIFCEYLLIFDRNSKEFQEYKLNKGYETLSDLLKKQKDKEFPFICGINT